MYGRARRRRTHRTRGGRSSPNPPARPHRRARRRPASRSSRLAWRLLRPYPRGPARRWSALTRDDPQLTYRLRSTLGQLLPCGRKAPFNGQDDRACAGSCPFQCGTSAIAARFRPTERRFPPPPSTAPLTLLTTASITVAAPLGRTPLRKAPGMASANLSAAGRSSGVSSGGVEGTPCRMSSRAIPFRIARPSASVGAAVARGRGGRGRTTTTTARVGMAGVLRTPTPRRSQHHTSPGCLRARRRQGTRCQAMVETGASGRAAFSSPRTHLDRHDSLAHTSSAPEPSTSGPAAQPRGECPLMPRGWA